MAARGFHECSEFFNTPAPTRPARLGLYRQSARHAAHRRSQGQRRDRRADPPLAGPVTRAFVFLSDVVDGAFLLGGTAPSGHRPDLWATTMTNTRSLSGAPLVSPGGFIVVNISGGGPLRAARDSCANARLAGMRKFPGGVAARQVFDLERKHDPRHRFGPPRDFVGSRREPAAWRASTGPGAAGLSRRSRTG